MVNMILSAKKGDLPFKSLAINNLVRSKLETALDKDFQL